MAFNSRQFEWADVTVIFGGSDLVGIRGIKYDEKAEKEALFAKGRNAHSIQTGNITVEGEITVLQSELESLIESGGGSILGIVADAEVNYGNPPSKLTTDRIEGLQFTESPKELKQGDKNMEISLPFIALKIVHNV